MEISIHINQQGKYDNKTEDRVVDKSDGNRKLSTEKLKQSERQETNDLCRFRTGDTSPGLADRPNKRN